MILNFKCKETKKIFNREYSKKYPNSIQKTAMRKLWIISAAASLNDLRIPLSNRLEKLKGNKHGQYSIRINKQWRICFNWQQGNASGVKIIDYH